MHNLTAKDSSIQPTGMKQKWKAEEEAKGEKQTNITTPTNISKEEADIKNQKSVDDSDYYCTVCEIDCKTPSVI